MSVEYRVGIIFGLEIDWKLESKTIKKFDVDTGEPYFKEVERYVGYLEGTSIPIKAQDEMEDWNESHITLNAWYGGDPNVVGIRASESDDDNNYIKDITNIKDDSVYDEAKSWFKETYGYEGKIKILTCLELF